MKAFAVFLILLGVLAFLGVFGFMNLTFGFIIGIFFGILFCFEGIRELVGRKLIGVGSLLFGIFLFMRAFKLFGINASFSQLFLGFVASYLIGIGLQIFFGKRFIHIKKEWFND
ncbi:MAG: hypothetical protein C0176_02165 [Mesoaciditoga sp.]|uniref:hypothetical protein n=1 Tax=Athalassotoga sp. TaxID=2022597 RepID=UPI000CB0FE44|nr:MAG: hypothetical protein C0185_02755 [Mesoaciditoga sp.]PMP80472.1 MAG: hypothetical protein C0176_02165 [Mesoaciditoga sp.]HEU24730.1 hypothetical protein [Mesoaciditoga lauensis]